MKNLKIIFAVPLVAGVLFGCNNDEVDNVNENQNTPVESTSENQVNNNAAKNAVFNFKEFSLDVDYPENKSYEADYDYERNGMEAELEDDRNNEKLYGDEAFNKMEPLLKKLTFDANTSNEEVINQVMSVFNIADDYEKIDIEVKFQDGTKKEYERMK